MKKGLRLLFIFALLITLVACGDREIPTFDDILNQTVNVGSDARNWEDLLENLTDNETSAEALVIEVEDNVNYDVPGTYNVTITVTDESDNTASFTFTVTVVDNVKPVISLVGNAQVSIIAGESFTDPGATYTDNVDGTGAATVTGSVNAAVAGTYTLTYSYTDAAGNAADSVTRTVTVVPLDVQAPVITLTGDATLTVEAGSTFTDPGATFSDNLDGTGAAVATGSVNTAVLGTYTLTYNYTDAQGNAATPVIRTINVVDTTAPVITVANATITIEVGSTFTNPTATASDNLDADATVTATGTVNAAVVGSYTLTYNHIDAEGNAATAVTVTVVVEDTTAPVVTLTGDATVSVEAGSTFTDAGATAVDNYDATASVVVTGTVDTSALGTYTITYTSTDAAGNSANVTRTVNVVDTTAPVITLNGNASVTVQINESYTELNATATDNLDASVTVSVSGTVDTATVGEYTITYTATDVAGNTSTLTRTVNVSDTPPRLSTVVTENYTMSIIQYYKYTNAEVFVLTFTPETGQTTLQPFTKLVVFNGNNAVYQRNFDQASNTTFVTSSNISENGFYFSFRSNDTNVINGLTYNVNTNAVSVMDLVGDIRFSSASITRYLVDRGGYYFVVSTGEDRGLYQFKEDLSLGKIMGFQGSNYMNFPIITIPNSTIQIIELNAYGMDTFRELLIIDTASNTLVKSFFYSNSTANPNVGEQAYILGVLDDKIIIKTTTMVSNVSNEKIYIYNLDGTLEASYDTERIQDVGEFNPMSAYRNLNALYFLTRATDTTSKKVFIYNENFDLLLEKTLSDSEQPNFSFDDKYGYLNITDFTAITSTLVAYPFDGSAPFSPLTSEYDPTKYEFFYTINNRNLESEIQVLFTQRVSSVNNNTVNYFFVEDGMFKVFTTQYQFTDSFIFDDATETFLLTGVVGSYNGSTYEARIVTIFIDKSTDTVRTLETDVLSFEIYNNYISYYNVKVTDSYAVIVYADASQYSTTKIIILYDFEARTMTTHTFETPLNTNVVSDFTVSESGDITIQLGYSYSQNTYTITSTIANFSTDLVVTDGGGSTEMGGFDQDFLIPNVFNGLDIKIHQEEGEFVPPTPPNPPMPPQSTFTIEIGNQTIVITGFAISGLFIVDLEGTENDVIYARIQNNPFGPGGYIVNLFDPELTPIDGLMTFDGLLQVDENFNEILNTDVSLFDLVNIYEYRVMD